MWGMTVYKDLPLAEIKLSKIIIESQNRQAESHLEGVSRLVTTIWTFLVENTLRKGILKKFRRRGEELEKQGRIVVKSFESSRSITPIYPGKGPNALKANCFGHKRVMTKA
ncbi:hypothetical protein H6P81_012770 [Aristolochia fimbriata]|uniref:Uncharacterized protein n=1 Tax=Aristolochia fimbriata TaxID=158543 RepID=A0AAV7EG09_ARIFI|nr:hypothetical protein H6P81_012770 [Aristolochia fimbriata]